jgi:recombination protein RecT
MPTQTPEQQAAQQVASPGTNALANVASAVQVLEHDLQPRMADLAARLAGRYPAEYFAKAALTQFRRNPDTLVEVTATPTGRASFLQAVMQAADVGLPFVLGRAYLVPFREGNTPAVQLIVGYQGLCDLVTAPGTGVTFVEAAIVYDADYFEYQRGTGGYLHHREAWGTPDGRGQRKAVWARVVFASGQDKWDVMSIADDVEPIRKRAPSARARSSPWLTDYDEMAKKTVLRRLCKTQRIALPAMAVLDDEEDFEYRRGLAASPVNPVPVAGPLGELRQQLQQRVAPDFAAEAVRVNAQPEAEATTPSTEPPAPVDNPPAAEPKAVDKPAGKQVACGATVADDEGATYTCSLRPGHAGRHSDGQHDWE